MSYISELLTSILFKKTKIEIVTITSHITLIKCFVNKLFSSKCFTNLNAVYWPRTKSMWY